MKNSSSKRSKKYRKRFRETTIVKGIEREKEAGEEETVVPQRYEGTLNNFFMPEFFFLLMYSNRLFQKKVS